MWKKNWSVVKSAGLDCNRTVNRNNENLCQTGQNQV